MFVVSANTRFEREIFKLGKAGFPVLYIRAELFDVLEKDPYNFSRTHKIKKLVGISEGDGTYRFRIGNFRIRYDIFGKNVVLHSISLRKDAY